MPGNRPAWCLLCSNTGHDSCVQLQLSFEIETHISGLQQFDCLTYFCNINVLCGPFGGERQERHSGRIPD
eukprot:CAMPEP_0204364030 /NCGR_PEP_ID=MMETSP0469-20131031/40817_1 /ASSEMBLY_ACC=CAM_ASM_000384 /TAXON_ID=2969 /ORGANISM="Oxyrrhis marina" /LENGTH=69 /DNA_ID=CAMNT_0051352857 /DNA_START=129 /DNA_END=338 /DNA_ORIENTATION=+